MAVSFVNGSTTLLLIGFAMTPAAGGDLTVIMNLLKYKTAKESIIYPVHPTEVGLIILEKLKHAGGFENE